MALVKHNNNSISAVTSMASLSTGSMTLLQTQTASSSATIDFTSGIDSTYDVYVFKFINMHPATNTALLTFQADTGTNTNYNQTMTTTVFRANQNEADGGAALSYRTASDQAQGTSFQQLSQAISNDNDSGVSGELKIFSPSSGTFVKHFISETNTAQATPDSQATYCAGYFNLTTALTRFRFKMSSGNIDSGVIKLYGIKDS
jgi:hypothetical protein